ncbi:MAG: hypothetical protein WBA74_15685, partial [Cyclobacteriaceae bacterium]
MKHLRIPVLLLLLLTAFAGLAQDKKILDHDAYKEWRRINDHSISNNGKWITYTLQANAEANDHLKLKSFEGSEILDYNRGTDGVFSDNSAYLFFTVKPDI